MKIVLLGYMGSGKTTIGQELAGKLNYEFIDLDQYIESVEKMTVPQLFATKGEIYFRKKEFAYLKEIMLDKDNFVLATGGGTPCYGDNMNAISQGTAHSFYLKHTIAKLVERLSKEKEFRPLIKNIHDHDLPEFIGKHLFERNFYYNRANFIIECTDKSIDSVVAEISRKLKPN